MTTKKTTKAKTTKSAKNEVTATELSGIYVVPVEVLERLKGFMSTEETRYYLNGICIVKQPNGQLHAAATDGHALGIINMEEGQAILPSKSLIIDGHDSGIFDIIKITRKLYGKMIPLFAVINQEKNSLYITRASNAIDAISNNSPTDVKFTINNVLIDGTFPDYLRVMPKLKDGKDDAGQQKKTPDEANAINQICFNPKLLQRFKDAGGMIGGSFLSFFFAGDKQGPMFVLNNAPDFIGVLMPARGENELQSRVTK